MCIITMSTLGTALGMSTAAISSATAASAAGVSALGVATGVANAALAIGTIGGAIAGGVSSYQSKKANAQNAAYQANIAKQNQKIAEDNAAKERQAGYEEANKQRLKTAQMVEAQRAGMAASGINSEFGTGFDLTDTTKYYGEMDALTTIRNANEKAESYMAQAGMYGSQSDMYTTSSRNNQTAAWTSTLGSSLSSIGSVASTWGSFKTPNRNTPIKGGVSITGGG